MRTMDVEGGAAGNGLAVSYRAISEPIPDARSARTHREVQVALIAGSIREVGFNKPVLVEGANGIIAGMAAQAAVSALHQGLPALGPLLRNRFDLSLAQLRALLACASWGSIAAAYLWGRLSDRISGRAVTSLGSDPSRHRGSAGIPMGWSDDDPIPDRQGMASYRVATI